MKPYLVKIPIWLQRLYPKRLWHKPRTEKTIYLTFDDGPIPEVTPWVLDQLEKYNAKATFFCIGDNIKKHPEIFKRILAEGHAVGNHTQNHLNGWKTNMEDYLKDIDACQHQMEALYYRSAEPVIPNSDIQQATVFKALQPNKTTTSKDSHDLNSQYPKLFRPPYGKATSKQAKAVLKRGYEIIMWDVLSMDYAAHISKEKCLANLVDNIQAGSIVVFHDSLKAENNLRYVLPKVLMTSL